jgi:hypothetical protein
MSQHTPGPWRSRPIYESGWVDIVADDPTRSAYEVASTRHEHAEANARLIAAAPELLEACKWVLTTLTAQDRLGTPMADAVASAINKATGKDVK